MKYITDLDKSVGYLTLLIDKPSDDLSMNEVNEVMLMHPPVEEKLKLLNLFIRPNGIL